MKIRTLLAALLTAVLTPLIAGGTAQAAESARSDAADAVKLPRPADVSLAGYANLHIIPTGGPSYAVTVSGRSWPSEIVPGNMRITFWGDDTWSDDKIWEKTLTTYGDGSFWDESILGGLNEDLGGQDEIFATVRITDPVYGATTFKTNVVVGYF